MNSGKSRKRISVRFSGVDQDDFLSFTEPATPNITEQAEQLKKTFSFDTLYKLSNDTKHRDSLQRNVLSSVWRPKNQKPRRPEDFERLIVFATRGAARTFMLTFGMRSMLNVVLALVSLVKARKVTGALLRKSLLTLEPIRFGLQFGIPRPSHYILRHESFVWLWRFTHHALRMKDGEHKRWHAWVAGAVSSLGSLAETRGNRLALGQQLTVRGLQGMYRSCKARNWISIPHGEFLIFGLACGQIMYAWIMSPDTIPKAYNDWWVFLPRARSHFSPMSVSRIQHASKVPPEAIPMHRQLVRTGRYDAQTPLTSLSQRNPTPKNRLRLLKMVQNARSENGESFGNFSNVSNALLPYIPPAVLNPWIEGIFSMAIERFYMIFLDILPVYASLHFIPALTFKRNQFKQDPGEAVLRTTMSSFRSSAFLATFVVIYHTWFSGKHAVYRKHRERLPEWLAKFLISKQSLWFGGFLTCASLGVEESKRRSELAMYVLPKAMESAWMTMRRKKWVPHFPFGPELLVAFGTASLMQAYTHESPQVMSGLVHTLIYQFIGNV
ncbi:hypothetical protein E3P84_02193 [Wallemia ichthyophaga]|nr:hypothetical protein E3P98_01225 [Wallemia ichthyophaga]TIB33403.1 hypothetical protein E3P84_02193 [Wallemia ichthyophaga]TIB41257.1 hypothetical protein E3P83_02146 [Wallemia ichthyophaga]